MIIDAENWIQKKATNESFFVTYGILLKETYFFFSDKKRYIRI